MKYFKDKGSRKALTKALTKALQEHQQTYYFFNCQPSYLIYGTKIIFDWKVWFYQKVFHVLFYLSKLSLNFMIHITGLLVSSISLLIFFIFSDKGFLFVINIVFNS